MRKRGKQKNQNQSTLFPELEQVKVAEDITMANKEGLATTSLEHTKTLAESGQIGDWLELYPRNWLYNAGVVGLLQVLSNIDGGSDIHLKDDGGVVIFRSLLGRAFQNKVFERVPLWHYWYLLETSKLTYERAKSDTERLSNLSFDDFKSKIYTPTAGKLFSEKGIYPNYYPPAKIKEDRGGLDYFIQYIGLESGKRTILKLSSNNIQCDFCLSTKYETETIDNKFLKALMPSFVMPNSYWNCSKEGLDKICSLCQFIVIHHHIAFTRLSDGSQIFINAPSFKLMYGLNNLVKKLYSGKQKSEEVRKILGLTLIEHSRRLWLHLGKWSQMNIEVVVRKGNKIDFYSPPYHIVRLLSDRDIAKLIHSAGDNEVLEYILNGEYEKILEGAYCEIREHLREKNNPNKASNCKKEKVGMSKLDKKLKLYIAIKERSHG